MVTMNTTLMETTTPDLSVWWRYGYNDTSSMYEFYKVPQLIFVSVLFVFIVVGNSCVLAAIQLSENGRKTRMNFFIMHLAIADLLVGLMCVMTDLLSKITIEWYAGNVMCKIIQYLQAVVTYASTYVLVSLSIDRYDAVARPMNFSRSAYRARVLISMAWLSSLLFALPALFLYHEESQEQRYQCWIDFPEYWHWQLFVTLIAVVTFIIPAFIIATCYIAIIFIIWTKGQDSVDVPERKHLTEREGNGDVSYHERSKVTLQCRINSSRGIIPQAKIRTVKMTLIIVIVFIICWSPFFMYNLLELFEHLPVNDPLSTFIQSAAPLNSAANPIIYGIFSTRICRNLRRIRFINCLAKAFCRCKTTKKQPAPRFHGHATSLTDQTCTTTDAHGLKRFSEAPASSLAFRRPSGLPVVRRDLTPRENLLLKTITERKKKGNVIVK